jgi:nucleoside-diphosphate-sugar epimerase
VRVAVTGASGFCGAAVARAAYAAGVEVVCLGRRPGPVGRHVPWDAGRDRPELGGVDAVVHLAAAVGDAGAESWFRAVNVDGTRRLLDAAAGRPVVWVSSASVYDPRVDRSAVREDHPVGGQLSAYGRTKAEGEELALEGGAVVLRPRAVYGVGDSHLVPRLRKQVRCGLSMLPGPDVWLSLTAVENLADACLAALDWPPGAYNISDSKAYRRDDAVRGILAAHGLAVRVVHVPVALAYGLARVPGTGLTRYAVDQVAHSVVLDIGKATARGWVPRRSLADHLQDVCGSEVTT